MWNAWDKNIKLLKKNLFNSDDKADEMKEFLKSIKSTLTVAQVVEGVKANARLTFDYISLVMLARYLIYFIFKIKTLLFILV